MNCGRPHLHRSAIDAYRHHHQNAKARGDRVDAATGKARTIMRTLLDTLHRWLDGPLGALIGGAAYGSWACYANLSAGSQRAILIGLVHCATSFTLTLSGVKVMNALYAWARSPWRGASAFCGSLALTYASLMVVHTALGTPHILLTLAPGLLPTIGFCFGYTLLLFRRDRQQQEMLS
jgi:hypothetical protein